MVIGVTNHFLIEFEVTSTEGIDAWYCKPAQKSMAWEVICPSREPTIIVLLNRNAVKLAS